MSPPTKAASDGLPRIDQPTLLMLDIMSICSIPASAKTGASPAQHVAVGRRPGKGPTETTALRIRSPENNSNVEAASDRSVEHIEQRAPGGRHAKVRCEESHSQPDAVPRLPDCFVDAPKGGLAVDQWADGISGP